MLTGCHFFAIRKKEEAPQPVTGPLTLPLPLPIVARILTDLKITFLAVSVEKFQ